MFIHARSAIAICVAALSATMLTGCQGTPAGQDETTTEPVVESTEAPTTQSATTQSATTEAATTSAAAAQPPAGDLGLITINQTIPDEYLGTTVTVQEATTVWIPAIAILPEYSSTYARMIGIRITTDGSQSDYLASTANPRDFDVIASDGTTIACSDLLTSASYMPQTQAIVAAFAGDVPYTYDSMSRTGEGWFPCMTRVDKDAAFDAPGFTIHYERAAAKTTGGTVLPAVTADIPVAS